MIELVSGNIFESGADALVNPVNCVGVAGKGLAQRFKERFPENFQSYKKACIRGLIRPGDVHVIRRTTSYPRWIVNFPTKLDWRHPSRLEYIDRGLDNLINWLKQDHGGIRSIALPALGCGLGGLLWADVRPLIELAFESLPDVRALVFEPMSESPEARHGS